MTELIKINETEGKKTVSARELHQKLEVTDRFNRWFESMLKYGFEKDVDFTSVKTSTLVNNGAKRELDEYYISIDMAKEICMIQRSEIGKKFRQYFIKCEEELHKAMYVKKSLRDKSKDDRKAFTGMLQAHGYTKPHEYIQTTMQMKKELGITNKKRNMTDKELRIISASETLSCLMMDDEYGFHEVNPVCLDAVDSVVKTIEEYKRNKIA